VLRFEIAIPDFSGATEDVLQPFDELIKFWQGLGPASLPLHAAAM
jgi:hypothetical protein